MSGAGKTSILRAIAGLWKRGRGSVIMGVPEQQVRGRVLPAVDMQIDKLYIVVPSVAVFASA